MLPTFDQRVGRARAPFDTTFGEPVTIEPKLVNSPRQIVAAGPDPNNPPFDAVGIFRAAVAVNRAPQPRSDRSETPDVLVDKTTLDLAVAQFTEARMPREGWTVVLSKRPDAPRFKIAAVKPDSMVRIVCVLSPHVVPTQENGA